MKKYITEKVGEISLWDFTGSFDKMINFLNDSKAYYIKKYPGAKEYWIDYVELDHEDSYSRTQEYQVFVERLETDREYEKRIKLQEKNKNKKLKEKKDKEKSEYELYIKLKNKFEK